jgi:hypothetical protein
MRSLPFFTRNSKRVNVLMILLHMAGFSAIPDHKVARMVWQSVLSDESLAIS